MSADLWLQAWREGRTGWHRDEVHPDLVRFEAQILSGGPHRVLVPLCGRSRDVAWLAARGHAVVGVELAEQGVEGLFADASVTPRVDEIDRFARYRAEIGHGTVTVLRGDWFATTPEILGRFDRAWDRAALVAVAADQREAYVARVRALLAPSARVLLNVFEYDTTRLQGPPFSIPEAAVRALFAGFDVEQLDRRDTAAELKRPEPHDWWFTTTWLLRAP